MNVGRTLAFIVQHGDTKKSCLLALYPVLVDDPNNIALISEISKSYGLSVKREYKGNKGRYFLWTNFRNIKQCVAHIEKNNTVEQLRKSTSHYECFHKKTRNDAQTSTMSILRDDDFTVWLQCANDMEYSNIQKHYHCDYFHH